MPTETVFLDAGGVLLFPNWQKVSAALAAQGIFVEAKTLASADFRAKLELDRAQNIARSTDRQRGWTYFDLVLAAAGIEADARTAAALADLHAYHAVHNLWEVVPDDAPAALARMRKMGLRLVIVSNANGTLHTCLDRVGLSTCVDAALDSHFEGVEKPDPGLFEKALARTGAVAATTVHVGDLYNVDVVGARRASIRPILLDMAGLYPDADCPRVVSLTALADLLESGSALS